MGSNGTLSFPILSETEGRKPRGLYELASVSPKFFWRRRQEEAEKA